MRTSDITRTDAIPIVVLVLGTFPHLDRERPLVRVNRAARMTPWAGRS